jgi:hypothetical protein
MPFSPSLPTRQQASAGRSAKTAIVALHYVTGAAGTVRDTIPVDPAERSLAKKETVHVPWSRATDWRLVEVKQRVWIDQRGQVGASWRRVFVP